MTLKEIPPAELEQVYLHVDEFMNHRKAANAKLHDLRTKRTHGQNTALAATFVITGSKDKITKVGNYSTHSSECIIRSWAS